MPELVTSPHDGEEMSLDPAAQRVGPALEKSKRGVGGLTRDREAAAERQMPTSVATHEAEPGVLPPRGTADATYHVRGFASNDPCTLGPRQGTSPGR